MGRKGGGRVLKYEDESGFLVFLVVLVLVVLVVLVVAVVVVVVVVVAEDVWLDFFVFLTSLSF